IYALLGYDYCVIEGFKDEQFSCVVLGDLTTATNVIMRDATPAEIFAARDSFEDYTPRFHV
ncbi:MAG TPA: hypothetical protein O0X17_01495, partial [Methanocorpusculum sp.]|nr:hypothetical protein [Methanocorpusculum sp.]